MTIDEQIEVMQHFRDGGEVELNISGWVDCKNPEWNFAGCEYRKKEYPYPMWFKSRRNKDLVVEFIGLAVGYYTDVTTGKRITRRLHKGWVSHTNKEIWEQIEEPKSKTEYFEVMFFKDNDWRLATTLYTQDDIDCVPKNSEFVKTGRSWML